MKILFQHSGLVFDPVRNYNGCKLYVVNGGNRIPFIALQKIVNSIFTGAIRNNLCEILEIIDSGYACELNYGLHTIKNNGNESYGDVTLGYLPEHNVLISYSDSEDVFYGFRLILAAV